MWTVWPVITIHQSTFMSWYEDGATVVLDYRLLNLCKVLKCFLWLLTAQRFKSFHRHDYQKLYRNSIFSASMAKIKIWIELDFTRIVIINSLPIFCRVRSHLLSPLPTIFGVGFESSQIHLNTSFSVEWLTIGLHSPITGSLGTY